MSELNLRQTHTKSKILSTLSIFIAVFIILLPTSLNGDAVSINLLDKQARKSIEVGSNFEVYEDTTSTLTVMDVLSKARFDKGPKELKIGPSRSHFWIRLKVSNNSVQDSWYITPKIPTMDVKAYRVLNEKPAVNQTLSKTDFPSTQLQIPSGTTATFLLRVRSLHIVDLSFLIMSPDHLLQFGKFEQTLITYSAAWFLIALILYNLFLYISIREKIYLFYIAFALVNTHIGLLAINHPAGVLEWFGIDWFIFSELYRPCAPLTAFIFARELLKIPQNSMLNRIFTLYISGLLVLMLISIQIPPSRLFAANDVYFNVGIVILFMAGFFSKIEYEIKMYYFVGWGSFLVGVVILIFASAEILPDNSMTRNAHLFGQMIEMLLMSLALAARIKQLQGEKTTAEVKYRTKSDFLAYWTHEIRTPVCIFKEQLEVMDRDPLIQKIYGPYVTRLLKAIDHIESLIKDSIDHKQIETGTLEVELSEVRTIDIVNHVRKMMEPLAMQKNLKMDFEIMDVPSVIRTDPFRLKQILINMIENSIKFTTKGGVRVILAKSSQNIESSKLWITVEDDGIGINSSRRHTIFRMLNQTERSGMRFSGDMGLGLELSIKLARLLGGDIRLCDHDEQKGRGARFLITIDIGTGNGEVEANTYQREGKFNQSCEDETVESCLAGMKVLLAQELDEQREIYAHFLKYYGAEVIEVRDEHEAKRAAKSSEFDLILMDLCSSGIDGTDIAKLLSEVGAGTPIIVLAEQAIHESSKSKIGFTFTDYLVKPVHRQTLIAKASEYFPKRKHDRPIAPAYTNKISRSESSVIHLLN